MPPLEETGSVRDDILAAFEESKTTDTSTPDAESKKPIEADVSDKPVDRAPDGGKKDVAEKPAAAPKADSKEPEEKTERKPLDPPARWTKTQKEWFSKLDPEFQKQLLENDKHVQAGYTKATMEAAELRNRYGAIDKILADRRNTWARQGLDDVRALNMVFGYWDLAQRDPISFLHTFAQERGIDLASAFGASASAGASAQNGMPQFDGLPPVLQNWMQQMQNDNINLRNQLNQITGRVEQSAMSEQAKTVQQLASELQSFQSEVDENGQPRYPFFEDVRRDMSDLMRINKAENLKDAYEKAVRLNPEIWSKIQESQEIARKREDERRRSEEAARAKRAGSSVSPSAVDYSPAPAVQPENLSIRQLLEQGFAKAAGGNSRI